MQPGPPKYATKFLRWFCREDYIEEIEGDLTELFEKQYERSPAKAKWNFTRSVLGHFRPEFVKKIKPHYQTNTAAMFRHNLLITYRNFLRAKSSFLINLIGLSTGLACALLVYLWVADELSVDKFHQKHEQLYQVMGNRKAPQGIKTYDNTPAPLGESLLKEMPEVELAVTTNAMTDWYTGEGVITYEDKRIKAQGIFASEDFFNVFSWDLIQGNKDQVLADKNGVVISESLAIKMFNTTDSIIGRTFAWTQRMRFEGPPHITGIFHDPPANSTKQFDLVFNFQKLIDGDKNAAHWNAGPAETYLVLKKGTDINEFNKKISGYMLSKVPNSKSTLFVSRYSDKYLHSHYENGVQAGGRIEYVWLFSLIALFILAIACINFMNLSTAQASRKMKEIGVKKTMGASRNALIIQFLGESTLMAFLSLAVAAILVLLLLPQFNEFTNKRLHFAFGLYPVLAVVAIVLFTGIVSGCYPAFYLAGFDPIKSLKGKLMASFGERWIRKGLVISQFVLSVVFIVAFLIVNQQLEFIQTKNLGYNKDNVVIFERQGRINWNNHETFMTTLRSIPGVISVSCMNGSILDPEESMHSGFSWAGQPTDGKQNRFPSPRISHEFIETIGIEMKAGRSFSGKYTVQEEESKIIVNEAAVKMMGINDPVGRTIYYGPEEKQIIGVVKDFHLGSLHDKVGPAFFMYGAREKDVVVKVRAGSERAVIESLGNIYEKFHSGYPFDFKFLDEDYQALYASENKMAVLSKYFAAIAIIIPCLGLLGLAAFTVQTRRKEIGIRKVLGATEGNIVRLLSVDFTRLVLIAIAIAIPLSYLVATKWLESFAYRIELKWWIFAAAGFAALLMTWFTIGLQTLKAARVRPTKYLQNE
jgi:ABC-type antimicrobial peptide transport system permease subunit